MSISTMQQLEAFAFWRRQLLAAPMGQQLWGLDKAVEAKLMNQAPLYALAGQKVDFYDHDVMSFNFDLTSTEKSVLSDAMVLVAIEREASTLLETCLVLSSDAKSWSPNEGRKTFMDMWETRRLNFENRLQKYNTHDRLTGEIIPDFDYSSL